MLQDRVSGDVVLAVEDDFPCEATLGPLSYTYDATSGVSKVDAKWKPKLFEDKGLGATGKGSFGVSIHLGDHSEVTPTVGGSGGVGPFAGKIKVTLTNWENPWDSRQYRTLLDSCPPGEGRGRLQLRTTMRKMMLLIVCATMSGHSVRQRQ